MAYGAIPQPAEAPLLFDQPFWNPLKEPCTSRSVPPPHTRGVNVAYADGHARFSGFTNRLTTSSMEPEGCMENWWFENSWKGFFQ
jgi:prepilin-type processing-associated H-X9-DG protein